MDVPKTFISYSHDSELHRQWVLRLATDLRTAGIDATLDQWDLSPGEDIVAFMVNGIATADRVILVCTDKYVRKAENATGGVGYERLIVTGELVQTIDTKKFLPIVRSNPSSSKIPTYLGPRLYIDFSSDSEYSTKLEQLVREIHGAPSVAKPPLGQNPFAGTAPPAASPARVVGASGVASGGQPVLDDEWFNKHKENAMTGLGKLALNGAMELRFALHDPINKSQIELLNAVRKSEIQTFGWPIGVVLDNTDDRPRPVADGIVAEISIPDTEGMSGRSSYDLWALRNNGDFYLLQSLFEDQRAEQKLFVDSRMVRVTESLMFCANLYENLGVTAEAPISVRVTHTGLANRSLTTASSRRHVFPTSTTENVSQSELNVSVEGLRERLVDHVVAILEPMFMLFDFKRFERKVYADIVHNFEAGRIT